MENDIQHELRGAIVESDDLLDHLTDKSCKYVEGNTYVPALIRSGELLPPRGISIEDALRNPRANGWKWTNLPESLKESSAVQFLNRISVCLCGEAALHEFANLDDKATYPLLYGFDRILSSYQRMVGLRRKRFSPRDRPASQQNIQTGRTTTIKIAFLSLLKYVRGLKRSQLWRRFAIGLYMTGSVCGVVRADQSGVEDTHFTLQSTDGVIRLIRLLVWLSMGDRESFGFDPSFGLERNRTPLPLRGTRETLEYIGWDIATITCGNKTLKVDSLIYNGVSICGRGTRVFRVYEAYDEAKTNPYALKILWEDIGRDHPEAFFHDLAISRNVGHVLLAAESHRYAYDTTLHGIRGYDNGAAGSYSSTLQIENRREARILLPYHAPLREFTNIDGLVRDLIGAIKGHQSLYEASILHRDVSERNILLGKDDSVDEGFIIDLDMASLCEIPDDCSPSTLDTKEHYGKQQMKMEGGPLTDASPSRKRIHQVLDSSHASEPESLDGDFLLERKGHKGHRTGTIPYMACDILLEKGPHELRHDLESFFYVLFLIPFTYDSPLPRRQYVTWKPKISEWCRGDMRTCGNLKRGLMMDRDQVLELLTEDTAKGWREEQETFLEYLGLVWRIYSILRPIVWMSDRADESNSLHHKDLLEPMTQWLGETSASRKIPMEILRKHVPAYYYSINR
ncbi:hypothetical protein BZG36_05615 [Bifiguratus adelaidae]|uniref:Protein kinase domain-containing protein n=1 Tax=Bifiguratus adelaidae TaxID=1938954 RepID=A0A261XTL9_9FUNG|nr:hypothetical protein BZG36_05615 [Bifiguratus adelaidae]